MNLIDEVIAPEKCAYCGQNANMVVFEECCIGQFIDCACNGNGLPIPLCYQCEAVYQLEQLEEKGLIPYKATQPYLDIHA